MAKMNSALKWTLIIGGLGVTGVVGFLILKKLKKDKSGNSDMDSNIVENQPREEKDRTLPTGEKTPFKNKAEGDAFRRAVNKYAPDYAKQIDLSVSGAYDNSYIRMAYKKYGSLYNQRLEEIKAFDIQLKLHGVKKRI